MPDHDREAFLSRSKSFCMMPWVHMHFWPNGNVFPCCIADSSMPIGNYPESSIENIWNGEAMRRIRSNMLQDLPSPECSRCYLLERDTNLDTLRTTSNINFAKHFHKVISTGADGSVPQVNLAYLDVRFSNLCNLRCLTCGPLLSSSWYDDHKNIFGDPGHPKVLRIGERDPSNPENFWKELEPHLLSVEQVYFAGGEPLLSEEHYRVLEFWIANGKTDVDITYTTNFTTLKFRHWDACELWKKFSRVQIVASLDASGPRAEYLRKGTRWINVEENRRRVAKECPHVAFMITPTVGAYNALHFPDFHREWVELGFIQPNDLRVNIISHPMNMSLQVLPDALKRNVEQKCLTALEYFRAWSKETGKSIDQVESGYSSILSFMWAADETKLIPELALRTRQVDRVRNVRVEDYFPEIDFLPDLSVHENLAMRTREGAAKTKLA